MPTLIEVIEQRTQAAMNHKDVRHPFVNANGAATPQAHPVLTLASVQPEPVNGRAAAHVTAVDAAMKAVDADAHAALMKLRELVVGPSQKLNEARLEELMRIFEEREGVWDMEKREMLRRNSELETTIHHDNLNQLKEAKAEFIALTDAMAADARQAVATVRDELANLRREAQALVAGANLATDRKLESHQAWTRSLMDGGYDKMLAEMEKWAATFEARIQASQREAQLVLSRAFMEASETLASAAK